MVFLLAYRFYASFLARRVLGIDNNRPTPAKEHADGRDFVPTKKVILFGHHFAAISGAGPLIGPVLAAQFGYMPSFIWILIGAVLAGAVHDMIVLFASIRHDGQSLLAMARAELGKFSGFLASIALLFLIIITMAGASISVVNALFSSPWGTFIVGVTIPISIFIGVYLKWIRPHHYTEASIIGVILLLAGIYLGPYIKDSFLGPLLNLNKEQLYIIIPAYSFFASILPVWLLLIPRDYISSYIKLGTVVLMLAAIILVNPSIQMPAFTSFVSGGGPIINGAVWPFLFITLSCGAISGYHSVVCCGTTPKLVEKESDIKLIGYGSLLAEGFVALMALLTAVVLYPGDYFAINTAPKVFQDLGMFIQKLPEMVQLIGQELAGRPGGSASLAVGMAQILSSIPIGSKTEMMKYWYFYGIAFQGLFILTLIDAGTRAGRYLLQEIGGTVIKPLRNRNWLPGIVITGGLICLAWGYLLYGGNISQIWPLFGVCNQLVGSVALAIGTTMLIKYGKKKYIWVTIFPLVFLLVTSIIAGYQNIFDNYLPGKKYVLAVISAVFIIVSLLMIGDCIRSWIQLLSDKNHVLETAAEAEMGYKKDDKAAEKSVKEDTKTTYYPDIEILKIKNNWDSITRILWSDYHISKSAVLEKNNAGIFAITTNDRFSEDTVKNFIVSEFDTFFKEYLNRQKVVYLYDTVFKARYLSAMFSDEDKEDIKELLFYPVIYSERVSAIVCLARGYGNETLKMEQLKDIKAICSELVEMTINT